MQQRLTLSKEFIQIHVVKVFANNKQETQDLPFNLKHIPYLIFVKEYEEPIIGESCIISNSISVVFSWEMRGQ